MSAVMKVLLGKAAPVSSSSNGIYASFIGAKSGLHMRMLRTTFDKLKFTGRKLLLLLLLLLLGALQPSTYRQLYVSLPQYIMNITKHLTIFTNRDDIQNQM